VVYNFKYSDSGLMTSPDGILAINSPKAAFFESEPEPELVPVHESNPVPSSSVEAGPSRHSDKNIMS
jgi:hypothetical protein